MQNFRTPSLNGLTDVEYIAYIYLALSTDNLVLWTQSQSQADESTLHHNATSHFIIMFCIPAATFGDTETNVWDHFCLHVSMVCTVL